MALGPGCFVKGLEYSAGVKAQVVGKPNVSFFHSALLDEKPNEVVMVGDVRPYKFDYFVVAILI